jgi:hypothetical protein
MFNLRPSAIGAFASGGLGVGISANFLPSLVTATMWPLHQLFTTMPPDVTDAWRTIFLTFYSFMIGGLSAAFGAYVSPPPKQGYSDGRDIGATASLSPGPSLPVRSDAARQ